MGSIYVPRKRGVNWIYDENSWKIAVSNQSPNQKEAGKHITTMSKLEQQIIVDYIHTKGYQLGESTFKKMDQDYKPGDNEKWAEKKPTDKKAKRLLETIIVPGISNKYQLRDEMNIIYFQDLEKALPQWPWPFKIKEVQHGFFK